MTVEELGALVVTIQPTSCASFTAKDAAGWLRWGGFPDDQKTVDLFLDSVAKEVVG